MCAVGVGEGSPSLGRGSFEGESGGTKSSVSQDFAVRSSRCTETEFRHFFLGTCYIP